MTVGFHQTNRSQQPTRESVWTIWVNKILHWIPCGICNSPLVNLVTEGWRFDRTPRLQLNCYSKDFISRPMSRFEWNFTSQFSTQILHLSGSENIVADAFSRLNQLNMPIIVTTQQLQEGQENDAELQNILQSQTSLRLQKLNMNNDGSLYCDTSTDTTRCVRKLSDRRLYLRARLWGCCALRICSKRSDAQQRILRWSSEKIAWCRGKKTIAFLVKQWLASPQ